MLSDRRIGPLRIVIANSSKAPEVAEAILAGSMNLGPWVISGWPARRRDAGDIVVEERLDAAPMLAMMRQP